MEMEWFESVEDDDDIYTEYSQELLDNDEITGQENAFMFGYNDA